MHQLSVSWHMIPQKFQAEALRFRQKEPIPLTLVMSHYPGYLCKIWRKTDLLFQKWQEFGEFWPEHLKVSKICTFIGSFCATYLMFNLKKYRSSVSWHRRVMQNLKKTDLWFGKWHEEYGKFSPEHLKASELWLWWNPLIQSRESMSSKFTEELRFMTMKNDAKSEEELTCHFKIDMWNLINFDPSTWKSQNWDFDGSLHSKIEKVWA